jgi:hypothetical protein
MISGILNEAESYKVKSLKLNSQALSFSAF